MDKTKQCAHFWHKYYVAFMFNKATDGQTGTQNFALSK